MPQRSPLNENIQRHYERSNLDHVILAALEEAGKDTRRLDPEDLAPLDEFHIRGRAATLELAQAAGIDASHRILDVGSGLGGPARCLASEFGCRVTGIDLSGQYCRVAAMLSDRVGLGDRVSYRQGDALNLPFADETFDVVWTEHMAMNVPDKARLYGEMCRVLVPGGTLAIYDILEGPVAPVYFPVPWARTPDTSALAAPDELRSLLESVGFEVAAWQDTTEVARDWFIAVSDRIRMQGVPPLGWNLLMGDDFQTMVENQRRNLEEDRIILAQIVARKSS